MTVDDFSDLWTSGDYVLVRVRPTGPDNLMPMTQDRSSAVLIDDDELEPLVIRRMLDEGVPVVDGPAGA